MMNLKILRLTGVASALSAIFLTQAAEEASPETDDLDSSVVTQCVTAKPDADLPARVLSLLIR
jgi:hypothetical protein